MIFNQYLVYQIDYEYIGCAGVQSCASAIIEIIRGMSLDLANKIEVADIINFNEDTKYHR